MAKPDYVTKPELRKALREHDRQERHDSDIKKVVIYRAGSDYRNLDDKIDRSNHQLNKKMDSNFKYIQKQFGRVDDRFAQMSKENNRHFARIDDRFAQMSKENNRHFARIDDRFAKMSKENNHHFAKIDDRFAKMSKENDRQFAQINHKLDSSHAILNLIKKIYRIVRNHF